MKILRARVLSLGAHSATYELCDTGHITYRLRAPVFLSAKKTKHKIPDDTGMDAIKLHIGEKTIGG